MATKRFKDDRESTKPFVCQRCGADKLCVTDVMRPSSMGESVIVLCRHCGAKAWLEVEYSFAPEERPNVRIAP